MTDNKPSSTGGRQGEGEGMPWTWQYNPITDDADEVWVDEPQQPNPQDGYDETEWLCSELAGSEEGRKKMVAAIGAENLAALGYVPEPVWRDAVSDPPPMRESVLVACGGRIDIGYMNEKKYWFTTTGRFLSKSLAWLELPALPGKGE